TSSWRAAPSRAVCLETARAAWIYGPFRPERMMFLVVREVIVDAQLGRNTFAGGTMWWGIGFGALLYIVLLVTLGVMTLRKGHWVMFILGLFLPIFWLIGAVIPPTAARAV